jgi:hypothetical protein
VKLPATRTLCTCLGGIYLVMGVLEVVTHRDGTAVGLLFWGGSLLGGGALVLAGTVLQPPHRATGLALVTIGTVLGINATLWTVLVPAFAVFVLVRSYRRCTSVVPGTQRPEARASREPRTSQSGR